jgi:hypothetical protein
MHDMEFRFEHPCSWRMQITPYSSENAMATWIICSLADTLTLSERFLNHLSTFLTACLFTPFVDVAEEQGCRILSNPPISRVPNPF